MRKLAFLYLCLAMASALHLRCSLEPFETPSWDVELNLPVLTEDYTFRDLADDEEAIRVLGDSLYIEITEALTGTDLGGRFAFNAYEGAFGVAIGAFEVAAMDSAGTAFSIAEVWEAAALFSGYLEVPPFCFPAPRLPTPCKTIDLGCAFAWAEVETGVLRIRVENNLAVSLGDPLRGCPLVIRVNWDGGAWDSVAFGEPIPAGESHETEMDLAGRTIASIFQVAMSGGSPGSDGPVDFSHLDQIDISAAPRNIRVNRALASIPAQSFESQSSITVEDSTRAVLAGIESGTVALRVFNNMAVALSVEIVTDNLTSGGESLSSTVYVPALSFEETRVDLSGFTLDTGSVPGDPWYGTNTVTFHLVASTPGTSGHVEVASSDSVLVEVNMSGVTFDGVTGTLKPTRVAISETHDIDLPEICRAISISDAMLALSIRNEAMVGGEFEVEVTGEGGGGVATVVLAGDIVPADLGGAPSEIEYEYDSQEVRDLIAMVPDRISIEGQAVVWGKGRVCASDALEGDLRITAPLVFEVESDTVEFDPRDFEVPEDVRDEIRDAAREVVFRGRLVTDFDLSGSFNVYFGADSAGTYDSPLLSMVEPGGFAPFATGEDAANDFEMCLTRDDLDVFLRDRLWVGLEVMLGATDSPVAARPDNYFRLEGHVCLLRRID